jgi:hypothetical protein
MSYSDDKIMGKLIFSIFFFSFLLTTTVLADVRFFSPNGEEITEDEYLKISNKRQKDFDPANIKKQQKNHLTNSNNQNKVDICSEESVSEMSNPENDCKGILYFDKYGSYISYPPACDKNGEKTLNSCFDICESEKEEKFLDLMNRPINMNNSKKNPLHKIQEEWDECVKNCRKRFGLHI